MTKPLDSSTGTPEQQLWVEVMIQALAEDRKGSTTLLERDRITEWVGSRDFLEVCSLAGIEAPGDVAVQFRIAISDGRKAWIARDKRIRAENRQRDKARRSMRKFLQTSAQAG